MPHGRFRPAAKPFIYSIVTQSTTFVLALIIFNFQYDMTVHRSRSAGTRCGNLPLKADTGRARRTAEGDSRAAPDRSMRPLLRHPRSTPRPDLDGSRRAGGSLLHCGILSPSIARTALLSTSRWWRRRAHDLPLFLPAAGKAPRAPSRNGAMTRQPRAHDIDAVRRTSPKRAINSKKPCAAPERQPDSGLSICRRSFSTRIYRRFL
jgi:hypothetical protein